MIVGWVALTELDAAGQATERFVEAPGLVRRDADELADAGPDVELLDALLARRTPEQAGATTLLMEPVTYGPDGQRYDQEPFPGMPMPPTIGLPEPGTDEYRVVLANVPQQLLETALGTQRDEGAGRPVALQMWTQLPGPALPPTLARLRDPVWLTFVLPRLTRPLVDILPTHDGIHLPWLRWVAQLGVAGLRLPYWPASIEPLPGELMNMMRMHVGQPPHTQPYDHGDAPPGALRLVR